MNWSTANKRDLVRERGSEDVRATPGMGKNKKKKPDTKKFRNMRAAFASTCTSCNKQIPKGTMIKHYYELKVATHAACKITK